MFNWMWPAIHGEHVYDAEWTSYRNEFVEYTWRYFGGIWLDFCLTEAKVATPGVADSFLRVAHLA